MTTGPEEDPSPPGRERPLDFGGGDQAPRDPDRHAHRRDGDLEAYGLGPGARPVPAGLPAGSSRYTWFVGVVAVLVIAYVSVNTITTKGPGSRGVRVGAIAPPFAAPLATGDLAGDVNVARHAGQGDAGQVGACSIHRPDVVTLCDQYARRPVVLAFFATRGRQCTRELDALQTIASRRKDVAVVAVAIRGDREDVRRLIAGHGWTFPVGFDHDGVLANLYRVAICPQVTFLHRGGRVARTTFGAIGARQLAASIDALAAGRALPKER